MRVCKRLLGLLSASAAFVLPASAQIAGSSGAEVRQLHQLDRAARHFAEDLKPSLDGSFDAMRAFSEEFADRAGNPAEQGAEQTPSEGTEILSLPEDTGS